MIARRRIWLTALMLCIVGALVCVGCGLWLQGVAWRIRDQHPPPVRSRPAVERWSEGELIFGGQLTCYLGMSIFLILGALLAILGRRLGRDSPPAYSDTTDIWQRNVPPDDDAKALEEQWRRRGGPADNN